MQTVREWKSEKDSMELIEVEKIRRKRLIEAINSAKVRARWSYRPPDDYYGTQNNWNHTLLVKINEVNKEFGGNAIITSPSGAAILDNITYIDSQSLNLYIYKVGILGGRYTIYVNVFLPDPILMIIKDDFFTSSNPECAVIYIDNLITY